MSADSYQRISVVTGSSGFLGSQICKKLLLRGDLVYGINRGTHKGILDNFLNKNFIEVNCDIRDFDISEIKKCDEIYHFAGVSSYKKILSDPFDVSDSILRGTQKVLDLAKNCNAHFLFASTVGVDNVQSNLTDRSCYDDIKRGMESYIKFFSNKHNIQSSIVRIPSIYGPMMQINEDRIIPNFIVSVLKNKDPKFFGNFKDLREYCHIDDFIMDIFNIMSNKGPLINYIPSSFKINAEDLYSLIKNVVDFEIEDDFGFYRTSIYIRNTLGEV